MADNDNNTRIVEVVCGATKGEGGTRECTYTIGGAAALPLTGNRGHSPRIALELCDDSSFWSPIVTEIIGDMATDLSSWARAGETEWGADFIRLYLTSTKERGYDRFGEINATMEEILQATTHPLIVEGSSEPSLDSEVFQRVGETAEGERILLGTAEADRYRSVAAASLAYGHVVIAQTPIDINLAKQLNILLKETGVPPDRMVIDPYTGALGYGFEYSYSVMERIRTSALTGDADLARPMISAAIDSLNIKEVREADHEVRAEVAVEWEVTTAVSAMIAGADVVCVRLPESVKRLRAIIDTLWKPPEEVND
jgi:acetyl-CoA decarbonylase/synthase complex subunit delta